MYRENVDKFPEIVRNAVSDIAGENLRIQPLYHIPPLTSWTSASIGGWQKGRVAIFGNAAHALPPSARQGVNQAFEDVYLFAGLLGRLGGDFSPQRLRMALQGWQIFGGERMEGVLKLNEQMEIRRLPAAAQAQHGMRVDLEQLKASMDEEFDKLFKVDYSVALREYLKRGNME